MTLSQKRRTSLIIIFVFAFVLLLLACVLVDKTEKKIPAYWGKAEVVTAHFYYTEPSNSSRSEKDLVEYEEIDKDKLPGLLELLNSMSLEKYYFHRDYNWEGSFGIELELDNGKYITYDRTMLSLRTYSRSDESPSDRQKAIHRVFINVTNYDFWSVMKDYFPSVEEHFVFSN